jgi:hypothetical protein
VRCRRCRVCRRRLLLRIVEGQLVVGRIMVQRCIVHSHLVRSKIFFVLRLLLTASSKKVMCGCLVER